MRVLTDEDYMCNEPCASCECMYVEDIWNEYQCDEKTCPHFLDYIRRQLVDKRKAYDLIINKLDTKPENERSVDYSRLEYFKGKAAAMGEALEILNYNGEYEDEDA